MLKRPHQTLTAFGLAGICMASAANAAPLYELTLTGTVSWQSAIPSLQADADANFMVGDAFSIVVYDGGAPVTGGASNTDEYAGAIQSASGSIGSYNFVVPGGGTSSIDLRNSSGINAAFGDIFFFDITGDPIGTNVGTGVPYALGFGLVDTSDNIFPGTGDPLPLSTEFDFTNFDTLGSSYYIFFDTVTNDDGAIELEFNLNSISSRVVPEPTSLALLGLSGLIVSRRRRS